MITVVINTLNEAHNIAACIESVRGFADEVVVCDMHSDDRTVAIAESLGARVVYHERTGFVEPARYFAISQASHEWVLVLDADERLTPPLAKKLRELAEDPKVDVVSFWSLFWYFGDWVRHGVFFSGKWYKFFRKAVYLETYNEDENFVHHNFRAVQQSPNQVALPSAYHIEHLAYPTIEKYVTKTLGRYACIEAELMHEAGQRFRLSKMLSKPLLTFIRSYFLSKGYRDGVRGLILSVLYAGFQFLIQANLWFLEEAHPTRSSASPTHEPSQLG
ncbi:glycosyltransferase family 2 protein [bacterium]|nr:glycosyltransferase family 2 protein [bacterium]